ncbi:type II toxin-antitoxin system Phd/YefM family antitoxin [Labrys wisconsinensis]|uniref:Antitoxin n=1 Tax=Labrys wisconsinensis TaxID=425677 RepID=A0ABU0J111_9HYPH|nr:type II toxin-antitoxin system Phd/YefM family antitoxin [Labrys wisconsinensis]MDQ0467950.1 prevent-host-death family protein [Labrys wisconsinensis]
MARVSSAEFQKNIGKWQDAALKEPVIITRNGRDRFALVDVEEYERLKLRDRKALLVTELSEEEINLILTAPLPEEAHRYNDEVPESFR